MPAVVKPQPPLPGVVFKNFSSLPIKDRQTAADKVAKLERKIFSANEGFDYDIELKKKNIGLILAFKEDEPDSLIGYLVYQRIKRVIWLHKLCVIESERKKGIARCLVRALQSQTEKGGGGSIHLWVDEHNSPARAFYDSYGFQQIELRRDYYAPGRAGLKMELKLGN